MTQGNVYAVYYTAATGGHPAGYVWNNIVASSTDVPVIPGSTVIADAARAYPIGSTYTGRAS